jgi:hypothetical protein
MQDGKKPFKRLAWALADDLHGPILQIAHRARKAKSARATLRPQAKADTLNQPTDSHAHLRRCILLLHPILSLSAPGESAS